MAFILRGCDNIREGTTGTGTTVSLSGAVPNSRAFSAKLANGDTTWAVIRKGAEQWEGIATYNTGTPNTLTQTVTFQSSNSDTPVSFSSGNGEAFIDAPSSLFDTLNLLEITVASGATTDIGAAQGLFIAISGTTGPITSFGTQKNKLRIVRHSGSIITHDPTKIILKGGVNRTTAANDIGIYQSDNSATPIWRELFYQQNITPREVLTAARTYYVRTDGSDSNTGLANTSGGAFLTIQKAVDTVCALDLSIYQVTIQVADGTYTGAVVLGAYIGSLAPILRGNNSTPANVVISTTSATAVSNSSGRPWTVLDLKIQTTTSGYGLLAQSKGDITFGNLVFGACALSQIAAFSGAAITGSSNFAVSGGAQSMIVVGGGGGVVNVGGLTVTFSNSPAYSTATVSVTTLGNASVFGMTFTNGATVTGVRYSVIANGVLFTNGGGANYIPGNSAGSAASGGQYI